MNGQQQFFKRFDVFSKPFIFFVGEKKSKSTTIGGMLSLSIFLISVLYFYYLINMYFSNQIQPKNTLRTSITSDKIEQQIEGHQIMFEYLIQGQPLKQFEKEFGKTLLTYRVQYHQFLKNGTIISEIIPTKECSDEKFFGFLCLDENFITTRKIINAPLEIFNTDYEILILPCDSLISPDCATEDEIKELIFAPSNYFATFTKISQYNPTLKSFEDQYKYEYIFLDSNLFICSRISFVKADTTVTSGLFIQTSEKKSTIYDYYKIDSYFTLENLEARIGIAGYLLIQYELNQEQKIIEIQHPMITEVFAQFTSIFNSLLTFGILAKMIADNHIIEEINNILLKSYYKKTAVKLLKNNQVKIIQKFDQKNLQSDKLKEIVNLKRNINEVNFSKEIKQYFKLGIFDRFKLFISRTIPQNSQNKEDKRYKGKLNKNNQSTYLKLWKKSIDSINIFELCKDIIQLKMAIKLILTKEQYSAIQFCGSEIFEENEFQCNQERDKHKKVVQKESNQTKNLSPMLELNINIIKNEDNLIRSQWNPTQPNILNKRSEDKILQDDKLMKTPIHIDSPKNSSIFETMINNNIYEPQKGINSLSLGSPKDLFEQQIILSQTQSMIQSNKGDEAIDMKESSVSDYFFKKVNDVKEQQIENKLNKNMNYVKQNTSNYQCSQESDFQEVSQKMSHLQQMDLIEENPSVQEYFLKKFLNQISNDSLNLSQINSQILSSLLIKDYHSLFRKEDD